MSWWDFSSTLALSAVMGAMSYVLFRYVADGWLGFAVAGLVGLIAIGVLRAATDEKLGDCPRCGARVETKGTVISCLCPACKTFLEIDRGQLVASHSDRVADTLAFGVQLRFGMELPDCCCVCLGPTARRDRLVISAQTLTVPYCAEHAQAAGPHKHQPVTVYFRSLAYATRVSETNGVTLVGLNTRKVDVRAPRWVGLFFGLGMSAAAALTYYGLSWFEDSDYVIVPASLKGLALWLAIKLLGKKWLAAGLATVALIGFGTFIASFKPKPRPSKGAPRA
jgi:hypothetical protein